MGKCRLLGGYRGGGDMRVGSLVKTTYPNTKVGIVIAIDPDLVKCCFGWVYKDHLEVLCE